MKRAEQRQLPSMAKLVGSTKRAGRAIDDALAFCAPSNKRIARGERAAAARAALANPDLPVSFVADALASMAEL